jgi:hypothetical protein
MCPDASELNDLVTADIDVKDGDIIVIQDAGEFVEFTNKSTGKVERKLQISIMCSTGRVKKITLNKTSNKAMIEGFGSPQSEDWVGKQAVAAVTTSNVGGALKRVIYLQPAK